MGKRITVYLNTYYADMLENIKKELEEEGYNYNTTDIIKISLLLLDKKLKNKE